MFKIVHNIGITVTIQNRIARINVLALNFDSIFIINYGSIILISYIYIYHKLLTVRQPDKTTNGIRKIIGTLKIVTPPNNKNIMYIQSVIKNIFSNKLYEFIHFIISTISLLLLILIFFFIV